MKSITKDITQFTMSDFYAMSIAELRDVAAFFGIDSPTTKHKKELVMLTYKAKCGVQSSLPPKTGRGRPTKGPKNDYFVDWDQVTDQGMGMDEFQSMNIELNDNSNNKIEFINDITPSIGTVIRTNDQNNISTYEGNLEIMSEGYGFIRAENYCNSRGDAYVHAKIIKKNELRKGDYIVAQGIKQYEGKPASITVINTVNGKNLELRKYRPHFEELASIYPNEKYKLELESDDISNRIIDLVCPIGKGQRAMISSPPQTGKTTLIKKIVNSLNIRYPRTLPYVVLVEERAEEITEITNSVSCPVLFSTFDESPLRHVKVCEMAIERAKRDVEDGRDVVVIIDSMTSLARSYNLLAESSCGSVSYDIDYESLSYTKKIFGLAKNTGVHGSLTIIATFDIETGSSIDDIIYNEFKHASNMELRLSSECASERVYPAIDLQRSFTKRVDLLLSPIEMESNMMLRDMAVDTTSGTTRDLIRLISETKNNDELCKTIKQKYCKL